MQRVWRTAVILVVLFGILPFGLAAKPADHSFGLGKGNKTVVVPANTWVGTFVANTAGTGHITKIELLVGDKNPSGVVRMAIYNATPCTILQDLGCAAVVDGWVTISGLDIPVLGGAYYYLAFDLESPNTIKAVKKTEDGSYSALWPYDAEPFGRPGSALDMPPGGQTSSVQYVMRAAVTPD